jgi:predicted SAM-dependent methyltransferase
MAIIRTWIKRRLLRRTLYSSTSKRLDLGAGKTEQPSWVPTDIDTLNLLCRNDWLYYSRPGNIDRLMAEHVWEHLTLADGLVAAQLCCEFLRPGGNFRIAVPDGNNPDPHYINHVRVGGCGVGADDHKVLYTHQILGKLLEDAGFKIHLLEYWDEQGKFNYEDWDAEDGQIRRSRRFDSRNTDGQLRYTSLILDARKPI